MIIAGAAAPKAGPEDRWQNALAPTVMEGFYSPLGICTGDAIFVWL